MQFVSETAPREIDRQSGAVKAWSFSALMKFNQCPYRIYLSRVAKHKEPQSEAAERGDLVHKCMEDYVRGDRDNLPKDIKNIPALTETLRKEYPKGKVEVEENWGFDANWEPCGFYSKKVWCRVKLDIIFHETLTSASIRDWKTGKKMGNEMKHKKQLEFYAIAAFLKYPELQFIEASMEYLDQKTNNVLKAKFERNETLGKRLKVWTDAGTRMTTAIQFTPKPTTSNCKFCPFHPDRGGQCIYGI